MAGDRWHSLPRPCDRLVDGISKRNHRVRFAGHGAVRFADLNQNDIWSERFNRTLLDEWAYRRPFETNNERLTALPAFVEHYNNHRPHTALKGLTPMEVLVNNVSVNHT